MSETVYFSSPDESQIDKGVWASYNEGLSLIHGIGMRAVPDDFGTFMGLRIYIPEKPSDVPGISIPSNFIVQKDIASVESFYQLAGEFYDAWNEGLIGKDTFDLWKPLFEAVPDPSRTKLHSLVRKQLSLKESKLQQSAEPIPRGVAPYPSQAIGKPGITRAYVPEAEWFSEAVRALAPEDIVTLLPPADLKLFMLSLGRVCTGASGTVWVGNKEPWIHTFRQALAIVGSPGVGKTTFMDMVTDTLKTLGYRVSFFQSLNAQFGLDRILRSDLATQDDLDDKVFKGLLSSGIAKSIVTGGGLQTERKFQEARDSNSYTALIALANDFNAHWSWGMDSGALARWKILKTFTSDDLQGSGDEEDRRPFKHIPRLAEKVGTTTEGLIMWLLRMSVDYFVDLVKTGELEHVSKTLSAQLQNKFPVDLPEAYASLSAWFHLMDGGTARSITSGSKLMSQMNGASTIARIALLQQNHGERIRLHYEANPRTDHPFRALQHWTHDSLQALSVFDALKNDADWMLAWNKLSEILLTNEGYRVSGSGRNLFNAYRQEEIDNKFPWLQELQDHIGYFD